MIPPAYLIIAQIFCLKIAVIFNFNFTEVFRTQLQLRRHIVKIYEWSLPQFLIESLFSLKLHEPGINFPHFLSEFVLFMAQGSPLLSCNALYKLLNSSTSSYEPVLRASELHSQIYYSNGLTNQYHFFVLVIFLVAVIKYSVRAT